MKNTVVTLVIAGIMVLGPAAGAIPPLTEDFSTTDYQGTLTDAAWDTVSGQLTLAPFTPVPVGGATTAHFARDVAVAGDVAFVADGNAGLTIVNITDPAAPFVHTTMATGQFATGICVRGDLAFIADGNDGLQVVDISNPFAPSILGTYDTFGFALKVDVSGDLAVVADDDGGVVIVDVSDPPNPALVSVTATNDFPQDVHVDGHHVYVADGQYGLTVLDISDPAAPVVTDALSASGIAYGVVVRGNHAFMAAGPSGLQVFDVTDPNSIQLVGSFDAPGSAEAIDVVGDRAFLAATSTGVQVLDVRDPANPFLKFSYNTQGSVFGVAPAGDLVYLADGYFGLQAVRVANHLPLTRTDRISYSTGAVDIHLDGNLLYLARTVRMSIHDVTDPTDLKYLGNYSPGSEESSAVWARGSHAYLGTGSTLRILDVTNPASIGVLGTDTFGSTINDIGGFGSHLCVLHGSTLEIVDVSDPVSPVTEGSLALPATAEVVKVDGRIAYLAADGSGVFIVGLDDPTSPALLGTYNTPGITGGIHPAGDVLYVSDWLPDALIALDVGDPTSPTLLSNTALPARGYDVFTMGNDAFVVLAGNNELGRYDVSDPANPVAMDTGNTSFGPEQVTGNGRYVFVRCTDSFEFLDVDCFQPYLDDAAATAGSAQSISIFSSNNLYPTIFKMRLKPEFQGYVYTYVTTYGDPQYLPNTNQWVTLNNPAYAFKWQVNLDWSPDQLPSMSSFTLDWLYKFARILAVDDVPNDQGRQVRLTWRRSAYDFTGEALQIVEYAVYRRVDPGLGKAASTMEIEGVSPLVRANAMEMAASGWDFVTSVPVLTEDDYSVVVPTLADSTDAGAYNTVFRVTALTATPGQFFHSFPDSGQSVDNLAPSAPSNLLWTGPVLSWDESADDDFDHFTVYGSSSSILDGTAVVVGYTTGVSLDVTGSPHPHYHVTARDFAGNESEAASTSSVSAVPGADARFALLTNVPNPFNPQTTIAFELPEAGEVRLRVTDVAGRLVRTLLDGATLPSGRNEAVWDGRDESGRTAAAGVYFYRIEAGTHTATRRMTLVK